MKINKGRGGCGIFRYGFYEKGIPSDVHIAVNVKALHYCDIFQCLWNGNSKLISRVRLILLSLLLMEFFNLGVNRTKITGGF